MGRKHNTTTGVCRTKLDTVLILLILIMLHKTPDKVLFVQYISIFVLVGITLSIIALLLLLFHCFTWYTFFLLVDMIISLLDSDSPMNV